MAVNFVNLVWPQCPDLWSNTILDVSLRVFWRLAFINYIQVIDGGVESHSVLADFLPAGSVWC